MSKSLARQRWFKGVHTVIVNKIEQDIFLYDSVPHEHGGRPRYYLKLHWRLGYNLFYAGNLFKAFAVLENVCLNSCGAGAYEGAPAIHSNSAVHLTTARCCVQLFHFTSSHYHLENAHKHFQNAIETMSMDLSAMMRLPGILYEFGRMLEFYGSFSSALEMYTRIVTNFPMYRGYFDTMYRTAIVGRHLSETKQDANQKEDMIIKSIDILTFLLEAVPSTISDVSLF